MTTLKRLRRSLTPEQERVREELRGGDVKLAKIEVPVVAHPRKTKHGVSQVDAHMREIDIERELERFKTAKKFGVINRNLIDSGFVRDDRIGTTKDVYGPWLKDLPYDQFISLQQWREWPTFASTQSLLRQQRISLHNDAPIAGVLPVRPVEAARLRTYIGHMDAAIASAPPIPEEVRVFRAFDSEQFGDLRVGDRIRDDGFVTVSTEPDMAHSYGSTLDDKDTPTWKAEIVLSAGTRMGVPASMTTDGDGNPLPSFEGVLPRGSEFMVVGIGADWTIQLVYVGSPEIPPEIPKKVP